MSLKRQRIDPNVLEPHTDYVLLILHNHNEASEIFLFPRSAEFKDILKAFRYASLVKHYLEIENIEDDNFDKICAYQLIMKDIMGDKADDTDEVNTYEKFFGKTFVPKSYMRVFEERREKVDIGCVLRSVSELITIYLK